VKTGEESERCLQKVERVRLYHFRDGNWSERARECTLHLNETIGSTNSSGGSGYRARIVIRTKETKTLVFNASLWPKMECQKHGASEKVTRICCYNVAETDGGGAVLGTYLISPSGPDREATGGRLRAGIEKAKLKCPEPKADDDDDGGGAPASADAPTSGKSADGNGAKAVEADENPEGAGDDSTGPGATVSEEEAPAKKLKTDDATAAAADTEAEKPTANDTAAADKAVATPSEAATTPAPSTGAARVEEPPPQQQQQQVAVVDPVAFLCEVAGIRPLRYVLECESPAILTTPPPPTHTPCRHHCSS
jgi:hypothetical protein